MKKKPSPWYESAFAEVYLRVYAHRNRADAEQALVCAVKELELNESHALLDLCCGAGRHQELFLRRGIDTIGLDLSGDLLNAARQAMPEAKLVRADARVLPFVSQHFDRLVNLFSSFGYFDDDRQHLQMLREMARVLKPGGRMMLDHMNPEFLRANLVPESMEEREGFTIASKRSIDEARSRVEKEVVITEAGSKIAEYKESVRLFAPGDFDALFTNAGLRVIKRLGDFSGAAFDARSPRQIVIAEKA